MKHILKGAIGRFITVQEIGASSGSGELLGSQRLAQKRSCYCTELNATFDAIVVRFSRSAHGNTRVTILRIGNGYTAVMRIAVWSWDSPEFETGSL